MQLRSPRKQKLILLTSTGILQPIDNTYVLGRNTGTRIRRCSTHKAHGANVRLSGCTCGRYCRTAVPEHSVSELKAWSESKAIAGASKQCTYDSWSILHRVSETKGDYSSRSETRAGLRRETNRKRKRIGRPLSLNVKISLTIAESRQQDGRLHRRFA